MDLRKKIDILKGRSIFWPFMFKCISATFVANLHSDGHFGQFYSIELCDNYVMTRRKIVKWPKKVGLWPLLKTENGHVFVTNWYTGRGSGHFVTFLYLI